MMCYQIHWWGRGAFAGRIEMLVLGCGFVFLCLLLDMVFASGVLLVPEDLIRSKRWD